MSTNNHAASGAANAVSDQRLAELITNRNLWYGRAVNDHDDMTSALRELQRLRAERRISAEERDALEAGARAMDHWSSGNEFFGRPAAAEHDAKRAGHLRRLAGREGELHPRTTLPGEAR